MLDSPPSPRNHPAVQMGMQLGGSLTASAARWCPGRPSRRRARSRWCCPHASSPRPACTACRRSPRPWPHQGAASPPLPEPWRERAPSEARPTVQRVRDRIGYLLVAVLVPQAVGGQYEELVLRREVDAMHSGLGTHGVVLLLHRPNTAPLFASALHSGSLRMRKDRMCAPGCMGP